MKKLRKILLEFINKKGYLLFKEKIFHERYILKADFDPLAQLFYQRLHNDFFFVQIGANDGVSFDPIYQLVTKNKVRGIVLEPIPDIFELLKRNYAGYPNVRPVNKAVHKTEKEMLLHRVDPVKGEYPDWSKGTASFNRDHHRLGNIDEMDIVEEKVHCVSFEELINEYHVKHIDLLQIDTEGYDFEIIKMIDFDKISPAIISFEHGVKAGISTTERLFEVQELLYNEGYNIIILENDAIAYKPVHG